MEHREGEATRPGDGVLERAANVSLERVGADAILYDRDGGRAHVLNASAARVWELCDGTATLDEVTSAFAAVHGLTDGDVRADVEELVTSFRRLQVLT